MTDLHGIVVCSFYTADDYYRSHAENLRQDLQRLGVFAVLQEIDKPDGSDWADICRKKVPFLAQVCEEHPDAKVFWIDVDCRLLDLPKYVRNSTADIIGFQRGFGNPLTIGYQRRSRFWEPAFLGISPTPGGRRFIQTAANLEDGSDIKATDDYFFEEAWRANAPDLTFQILSSRAIVGKAVGESLVAPFFVFGSSGNVQDFKGKVVQHSGISETPSQFSSAALVSKVRKSALKGAKFIERALPDKATGIVRRAADRTGLTHLLTGGADFAGSESPVSPHRARLIQQMVVAGQRADSEKILEIRARLESRAPLTSDEIGAFEAANAFAYYSTLADLGDSANPIRLAWWTRPYPGNFGDWLSPLIIARSSGLAVRYQSLTARSSKPHIIAVGSVGRFIRPNSVVVGTGLSSLDISPEPEAHYVSVRGPLTASAVRDAGGPLIDRFGDPALLISRLFPIHRTETNGRVALVRHFKHRGIPLNLPENVDELSVLMNTPDAIADFVTSLNSYDFVITSAMHVLIACQSYGIPSGLITFTGLEDAVHGSGIKYSDYAQGAGVGDSLVPQVVGFDLARLSLDHLVQDVKVSGSVIDDVESALIAAVAEYLDLRGRETE